MKNKLIIGAVSAAVILGGAIVAGAEKNDNSPTDKLQQSSSKENNIISNDEAVKIALNKVDGTVDSVELESKRGNYYYEIEIHTVKSEYDFDIDAITGEIVSFEEDKNDAITSTKDVNGQLVEIDRDDDDDDDKIVLNEKFNGTQNNYITSEKAIEIAEKEVNGKVVEIDLDDEDGRMIYEIELNTNNGEVELKLDAVSGKVLKIEHED